MAKIRKINVSEIVGRSPFNEDDEAIMPSGTVVVYEKNNNGVIEYVLRVHDGVTNGGVAISPGPGPVIFNGSDGIVPGNLNDDIAAVFNNGDVYITGGETLGFTGIGQFDGNSTRMLRFWNNEGRHSTDNDTTELVELRVGNDAAEGDPTAGFFVIRTEKQDQPENEKVWKFDSDGVLTLPVGGDIVDTNGNSVLGSGVSVDRNIWIQTFATDSGDTDRVALASSVEYDNLGNVYALFLHQTLDESNNLTGSYFSVAKFASTGEKLWSVRSSAGINAYTDGWGLAVDNANSAFYVAGRTEVAESYDRSFLVKFNSDDGSLIWSNLYDFDSRSDSPVVDIASDGNPVIVGYLEVGNDDDDGVTVTKIDKEDGSILWSQLLDGQGDDEAYGMAVGPNGEIVAVGYTSQIGVTDAVEELYTDPVNNLLWTTGGSISVSGFTADFTFTDGVPTFTNVVDTVGGRTVDDTIVTVLGSAIGGVDGVDDMVVKVATVAANDEDDRMLVVKYDSDGVIVWQKAIQFDAGYNCSGADADIDADGNVYINGNWRYDSGQAPFPTSAMSIVKFDSNGVKQWSRRVSGNCDDFTTSIVVGPENTLYLTGVTGRPGDTDKYIWVVAKYTTSGSVIWQRLIENNSEWSFSGGFFGASGGGSSLAVKEGYVALSGAFGIPFDGSSTAVVVQLDFDGTVFTAGDWEVKTASFSGVLSSDASDITVIDAGKTDTGLTGTISIEDGLFASETSDFLLPTLYRAPGGGDSLVNGDYTLALGDTGTVTLPAGGTITEGVVTSNPTIQLTPATPTVASQKLVIKGGAQYSAEDNGIFLTWNEINPQVSDTVNIVVVAIPYSSQTLYWWITPAEAGIADPGTGIVEIDGSGNGVFTFTVDSDDYEFTVRVSPTNNVYDPDSTGVETQLFNADAPTFGDHHLHLTTGDLTETSIFLGTDDHNVRTVTNGGIELNSRNYADNVTHTLTFNISGELEFPQGSKLEEQAEETLAAETSGAIATDTQDNTPGLDDTNTVHYIATAVLDQPWVVDRGYVRFADTTVFKIAGYNTDAYGEDGGFVVLYESITKASENVWPLEIFAYEETIPQSFEISSAFESWNFATDGILTLPGGGKLGEVDNELTRLTGRTEDSVAIQVVGEGGILMSQVRADSDQIVISTNTVGGSAYNWVFGETGNLTLPTGGDILDSTGASVLGSGTTSSLVNGVYTVTLDNDGQFNINNIASNTVATVTQEGGAPGNPPTGSNIISAQTIYSPQVVLIQPGWTVTGAGITATTTVTSVTETSPGVWDIVTDTEEFSPFLYDEVYTFTETTVSGYTFDGTALTFPNSGVLESGFNGGPGAPVLELRLTSPEGGGGQVNLTVDENQVSVDNNGITVTRGSDQWYFGGDGNLTVPGGIIAEYEEDFTITTSYLALGSPPGPSTKTFTFAANGDLTVPRIIKGSQDLVISGSDNYATRIQAGVDGIIYIGYGGNGPHDIYIGTNGSGKRTVLGNDRLQIMASPPGSSKGSDGDYAGMVAFNGDYIFYCINAYDGTTDIWKRVALTGGVW